MAGITGTSHYRAGVHLPGTVLVQPAALARGLAATLPPNVELFESSPVHAIDLGARFVLESGRGTIVADRLLLATNAFTPALGLLRRRLIPMVTFASLSRPLRPEEQAVLGGEREWGLVPEERMGTTVRRTRDHRILIRNTVRYATRKAGERSGLPQVREAHRRALRTRFPMLPDLDLAHTWGGLMGVTLNGASCFGRLDRDLLVAAGCNGVGVAMGTTAGRLLADLLVDAPSPLLADMESLPAPPWLPPEPLLGLGARATLALLAARAREEL
jgi:glycine/D-amino acid oxidase-like deaminating enzyme